MGSSQATSSVPGFVLLLEIQRPTRRIEHALSVQGRASWCFCSCGQPTQQLAGKKRGNAGSEWDGHLLPGVTDQQHMVEQVLSYGIKCQGGQKNVQKWSCLIVDEGHRFSDVPEWGGLATVTVEQVDFMKHSKWVCLVWSGVTTQKRQTRGK